MKSRSHIELSRLVEEKAAALGIPLRPDLSWGEDASRIREEGQENGEQLARFLETAEQVWFEG